MPTTISGGENITFADFLWATEQAVEGQACVLTFHGVPVSRHDVAAIWVAFFSRRQRYCCGQDVNYPWVDTPAEFFERCMRYLKENGFDVIALRDLERFVEPATPAAARL